MRKSMIDPETPWAGGCVREGRLAIAMRATGESSPIPPGSHGWRTAGDRRHNHAGRVCQAVSHILTMFIPASWRYRPSAINGAGSLVPLCVREYRFSNGLCVGLI